MSSTSFKTYEVNTRYGTKTTHRCHSRIHELFTDSWKSHPCDFPLDFFRDSHSYRNRYLIYARANSYRSLTLSFFFYFRFRNARARKLAADVDAQLKLEDPQHSLMLQAREAVQQLVADCNDADEQSVNIVNVVNVLSDRGRNFYQIQLSALSKKVLEQRGVKKDDITISDVTSLSKKLKIVFELKLGFKIAKGSRNTRVVLIPDEWARSDDRDLTEFSEESEDSDDADDNTLLEAIFDNDTHTTDFVVKEF